MVGNFLSFTIKGILLICMILAIAYFGVCIYGNINKDNPNRIPKVEDAHYSVVIVNTGNRIYSDEVDEFDGKVTVHGYWELVGEKFKYRDRDFTFDKAIFGEVTVRMR